MIGSGIAGLSAAFYLSAYPDTDVVVYEQEHRFGGRAAVTDDGEHCPRFFLEDYTELFAILRKIPGNGCRDSFNVLARTRRYAHTAGVGWLEISHLYVMLAKEVPLREKIRLLWSWRPSPLVAERRLRSVNKYGSLRNYSLRPLLRIGMNLFGSKTGYTLPGPTDEYLIAPWVNHLTADGVVMRTDCRVTEIGLDGDRMSVTTGDDTSRFDAVVVTAFIPDLVHLLNTSRIDHTVVDGQQINCAAFTLDLDPAEKIFAAGDPAFYCRSGVNVLVQPEHHRCVVLCTRALSTEESYILPEVRDMLGLEYPVVRVRSRSNQQPGEALFAGDSLRPERILRRPLPHVYFAGSHIRSSYPIDSAEAAVRSAFNAVGALRRDLTGSFEPVPAPGKVDPSEGVTE
ncbi:FAD-dependent oxidoreductase [Phytomonospora sp. NPDC050363]|uniref:FAD-dependent oxidoreductase n=1 Tax=Phytomonospora sp. NPDC050363 TaxID=3155642 RepID=UPI00340BA682